MSQDEIDDMMNDDPGDDDADENDFLDEENTQEMEMDSQLDGNLDAANFSNLQAIVQTYSAFICTAPAFLDNSAKISLQIPTSVLPLAQQSVYGFSGSKTILDIAIRLDDYSWTKHPDVIDISNPIFGKAYIGSTLIAQVVDTFFSPFFKPRDFYRAASHLLSPPGDFDPKKVAILKSQGYDGNRAENALALFHNNLEKATDFLRTGGEIPVDTEINISYSECPLLYFTLEVIEAFLDLSDHCCICRKELFDVGVKPTVCDNKLCQFTLTEIGVGNRVYQEIQRDALAADLVFSMFACAVGTDFLTPAPPGFTNNEMMEIIGKLPPMANLAKTYHNDNQMQKDLGERTMQLLRWVLLSNRSQLLSLNENLELKQFKSSRCKMFMALLSSPQKEEAFRERQQKYGSMYLWHGSAADRWHSILRNGLVNASGTRLQANGACYGSGIYFARDSGTSIGYIREKTNPYKGTALGKNFNCIGLCEIAKVPEGLRDNGWNHTLQDDKAVIVRFLLVNLEARVDVLANPPFDVPTLRDVLEYHAEHV